MKRASIVFAVVSLLVLADGIYQQVSNYEPEAENKVWGSSVTISDGTTLIISAAVLALIALGMWLYARREERRSSTQRARADDRRQY